MEPKRYDYILIAVLLASAYAISHLAGKEYDAYLGVWMLLMAVSVSLWLFSEGLGTIGRLIGDTKEKE